MQNESLSRRQFAGTALALVAAPGEAQVASAGGLSRWEDDCRHALDRNHASQEQAYLALDLFLRSADQWLDDEDSDCTCEGCQSLTNDLLGMYYTISTFASMLEGLLLGGEREARKHARHHFAAWLAELERKAA